MAVTLYVVRDRRPCGRPQDWVSVWFERPVLVAQDDGGARWCGVPEPGEPAPRGWVCNLWLAEAVREFGSYPSDWRMVYVARRRSADDRDRVRALLDGIERRAPRFSP